jgi:hypothetical protein
MVFSVLALLAVIGLALALPPPIIPALEPTTLQSRDAAFTSHWYATQDPEEKCQGGDPTTQFIDGPAPALADCKALEEQWYRTYGYW